MEIKDLCSAITWWERKKEKRNVIERKFRNFTGKIWDMELHIPFTRYDLLDKIVKEIKSYKGDRLVILGGDTFTFDSFSKFDELPQSGNTLENEVESGRIAIQEMCKYAKVVMIDGNHEMRWIKYLLSKTGNSMALTLLKQAGSIKTWLGDISNFEVVDDWFVRIGDGIFCHANTMSAVRGTPVTNAILYFEPRTTPFSVLFQGHTHRQAKLPVRKHLGIEYGVLSKRFDYQAKGRIGAIDRSDVTCLGFGVCEMVNGKAIQNTANFINLGWEEEL